MTTSISVTFDEVPKAVTKMTITDMDSSNSVGSITVQYNPQTLSLSRSVDYNPKVGKQRNWGTLEWTKGKSDTLSFQLLFDESEERGTDDETAAGNLNPFTGGISLSFLNIGGGADGVSSFDNSKTITSKLEAIYALTLGYSRDDSKQDQVYPAFCKFEWGELIFVGSISSMKADILLFDPQGNPRRATVDIEVMGFFYTDGLTDKATAMKLENPTVSSVKTLVSNFKPS